MMYKFKLSLKYSIEKKTRAKRCYGQILVLIITINDFLLLTRVSLLLLSLSLSLSLSIIHISSSMRVSYYSLGKGAQ